MARNINGGTDHIWWTIPTALPTIGTIAFWMRTTQTTTNALPLGHWNGSSRAGWGFALNNASANKLTFFGYDLTTQRIGLTSSSSVNDGSAHHIAATFNRNNAGANALYDNGTSVASGNSSASWGSGSSGFFLEAGDQVDTFWPTYVGDMWEIGYWSVNLTADEIAALAKGFPARLIRPASLIFNAPMVRDTHDIRNGYVVNAISGTTVIAQGRAVGGAV